MGELLQAQQMFYRSVFHKESADLEFISSTCATERFDVYRQTIFENMRNALALTFPGVWKLLGDECANSVAYAFCKIENYLPKTGCLDDFGHEFPDFLATVKELNSVPYIRDYAAYELLKHKAYCADEAQPIAAHDLQSVPEERVDDIKLTLVPSCFLMESNFQLQEIHAVAMNGENAEPITLSNQKSYAVIARVQDDVTTLWISRALWEFIKCIADGHTLSQAAAVELDLVAAISFMLQHNLISEIA